MRLNSEEKKLLERRSRAVRTWPFAGGALLCLLVGLGVWMFLFQPGLANPFFVIERIGSDSLPAGDLALMAAMLPILVLTCLALAVVMIIFGFAGIRNEGRLLAVIQRLAEEPERRPVGPGGEPGKE